MVEIVRRPHVENFISWSADKPKVLVLTADLTNSCEVGKWRDTYPERYFSMGMAEQNMMGFAAGLAREGFEPWLHTFAVFLYRRPLDQLLMSVAYPALPVRLVGFLPGVTTPGGVTHQAIDDVAVMRAVPNMTVLSTGDATEVESVLDVAHALPGPVYIRMLRGEMPRLFPTDEPFQLGKARDLTPVGSGSGSGGDDDGGGSGDVLVLTEGICTEEALRALPIVRDRGVGVRHLHISTLKPFDDPMVMDALAGGYRRVITMENHLRVGGLGSAVAEVMAERGIGVPLTRLGLDDTYAHGASQRYLLAEYGMDSAALVRAIEKGLGEDLGIAEEDLAEVRVVDVHSSAKAEAL
nr:transketolase [Actinomycetales bacterium]